MVAGGTLLNRKPELARILATTGIGVVLLSGIVALFYGTEAPRTVWIGGIAYLLVHCGLVVWLMRCGRARPGSDSASVERSR